VPEGDVVLRTARRLHEALAGQVLTVADLRVPTLSTVDLVGHRVDEVVAVGKHLLTRLAPDWTLHSHLRMDGSWHVFGTGDRWTGGAGHTIRAVLGNDRWTAVGYRVHDLALVRRADETSLVGHLGPDLLVDDWDAAEAERRLTAQPDRTVGEALRDQRCVAGIGNLFLSETLFLSGVDPWRPVGEVPTLGAVLERARRLMTASVARTGQTTTGDTRRGQQHWVYQREGDPCRRCGTTIRRAQQGPAMLERSTYWCPSCQPGPGPGSRSTSASAPPESAASRAAAGSRRPRRD
jgi:endonuclease VIII